MILALDPGLRGCGVAIGDNARLLAAAYVPSPVRAGEADIAACVAMARAVVAWCDALGAVPPLGGAGGALYPRLRFDEIVCEWPQVYTPGKQKGDPNDLPPLVGVECAICAFYPDAKHVTHRPSAWKGQLPKPKRVSDPNPMEMRVQARLDAEEWSRIEPRARSLFHNTIDACGLLLHHFGRFERYRVIPR